MMADGTVSSVINAYMADLVVRDKVTNHVCNVMSDDAQLVEELSNFLYNDIKIDDILSIIALRCFCYGCAPTELCSIDSVTDKQWELYTENVKNAFTGKNLLEGINEMKKGVVQKLPLSFVSLIVFHFG